MTTTLTGNQMTDIAVKIGTREAGLQALGAEDVKEIARSWNLKANQSKRDLIAAILFKEENELKAQARKLNEDEEARVRGFNDREDAFKYDWLIDDLTKKAANDGTGHAIEQIQKLGVLRMLEWAASDAETAATCMFAKTILAVTAKMIDADDRDENNPMVLLEKARQLVVAEPLMSNQYNGGSSSQFSNACDDARRKAASSLAQRWM